MFRVSENGVPENVVLLHGFGGTHRTWDGVIERLVPERYRPLAPDLPGHGDSADAPRPITFAGCVEHVLASAPESFVLVGYSMGGRIALQVALHALARVQRLVLVASTAGIEDPAERANRRSSDERLAEQLEREPLQRFVERWSEQPLFATDPPEVRNAAVEDQLRNRPDGLAAALRGVGTGAMEPLWDRLAELTLPVTILAGDRDVKFQELGMRMAESSPKAKLILAPGGHRLAIENPEAVAQAIESC
jgi:2-succinyl-6-hydroxy-2,4-cyclohexadiene-1-carboxylate synthase